MSGNLWPDGFDSFTFHHFPAILARHDFLVALKNSLLVGIATAVYHCVSPCPPLIPSADFTYRGKQLLRP